MLPVRSLAVWVLLIPFIQASTNICEICKCVDGLVDCSHNKRNVIDTKSILSSEDFKQLQNSTEKLILNFKNLNFLTIESSSFESLTNLISLTVKHVSLPQMPNITNQLYLQEIVLQHDNITQIDKNLCKNKLFLFKIDLSFNAITNIDSVFGSCPNLRLIDLSYNLIKHISHAFSSVPTQIQSLNLNFNLIDTIHQFDLTNLPSLEEFSIENNQLRVIDFGAFFEQKHLKKLNLANNYLTHLPAMDNVYAKLTHFYLYGNLDMLDIPDADVFQNIQVIKLQYAYHCCAFKNKQPKLPQLNGLILNLDYDEAIEADDEICTDPTHPLYSLCNNKIDCTPEPDLLHPCQNLLGSWWLRVSVWLISFIGITCNIFVVSFNIIQALFLYNNKLLMNVPKFLLINLAFADSLMAVYLLSIAVKDFTSRDEFEKSALIWQRSFNCSFAGFLSIASFLSSALSLAFITFERFYAIKYSFNLNKRISIKVASIVICFIWCIAVVVASMPLMEINNYSMYAVCLPLDTSTESSRIYVALLISVLITCFSFISVCYSLLFYNTLQLERRASQSLCSSDNLLKLRLAEDQKLIKNISMLVIANIICWGPLVLACLYGIFTYSDLNRTWIKILAVFIIPFNSLMNPVLYCLNSRRFRVDIVKLLKRTSLPLLHGHSNNMSVSTSH